MGSEIFRLALDLSESLGGTEYLGTDVNTLNTLISFDKIPISLSTGSNSWVDLKL